VQLLPRRADLRGVDARVRLGHRRPQAQRRRALYWLAAGDLPQ
jgi:hypothetical protein